MMGDLDVIADEAINLARMVAGVASVSDALDDLPEGGLPDEFRRGVAFAQLCRRQAEHDHAWALRRRGLDPIAALDRLAAAVEALAAERDALKNVENAR